MSKTIRTRMGDGELVLMSAEEIKKEILEGMRDAGILCSLSDDNNPDVLWRTTQYGALLSAGWTLC